MINDFILANEIDAASRHKIVERVAVLLQLLPALEDDETLVWILAGAFVNHGRDLSDIERGVSRLVLHAADAVARPLVAASTRQLVSRGAAAGV